VIDPLRDLTDFFISYQFAILPQETGKNKFATLWVPGVHFNTTTTLLIAAVLLGVVNAIVKPIAFILTLPVTILTLGLFLFVLNAIGSNLGSAFITFEPFK
jgi:hypothetical protein